MFTDRMISHRPTAIEYICGLISTTLVFAVLLGHSNEAISQSIMTNDLRDIILAISYSLASIWMLWVAICFFYFPLGGLLSGYNLVFSPPVKYTGNDRESYVDYTSNKPKGADPIEINGK